MLMKIWNWLLEPAFTFTQVNDVEETRQFMRRVADAKLGEERRLNRSWKTDSNWK